MAEIPASVKDADWKVMYAIAKKQALIGVLFHGIKQLPKELAPDAGLLMQWMGMAQKIRQQNIRLFLDSAKVCKSLRRLISQLHLERSSERFTLSRPLYANFWGYRYLP